MRGHSIRSIDTPVFYDRLYCDHDILTTKTSLPVRYIFSRLVRVIKKAHGVEKIESRRIIQIHARRGDENW